MKRIQRIVQATVFFSIFIFAGCTADSLVTDNDTVIEMQSSNGNGNGNSNGNANENACWGQASAVFAQMGEMGEHSSSQATPRIGLANLAQLLFDAGTIDEPTLQALGAFVADALNLSINACL